MEFNIAFLGDKLFSVAVGEERRKVKVQYKMRQKGGRDGGVCLPVFRMQYGLMLFSVLILEHLSDSQKQPY
jgi:hypothetical protein